MTGAIDWLETLDLPRALLNCRHDAYFDWHRDPWFWPELQWAVGRRPELLAARLNSDHVARVALLDMAKENFATRPAVVIEPLDRLVYQALVDHESVKLVGETPPWVFMGRLNRRSPRPGRYPQDKEWDNYRERLKLLVGRYDVVLKTDIVSCFASVPMDPLIDHVRLKTGASRLVDRLELMLRKWDSLPSRSGLMQRFIASSVLATSYLGPVDDVLHRYSSNLGRAKGWIPPRAVRWMDDIWLFGSKDSRLRRAQLDLQDAMRSIGLNMNSDKTDLLTGYEAQVEIQDREHSAVDAGLAGAPMNTEPIDALIDRLVAKPEKASRTSVKFATTRMRSHHLFDRIDDFVQVAERMPQASDALARLFRDSGAWRDLEDWFVEYAGSDWGRIEWSVAQLGTMFPSSEAPPAVHELLSNLLARDTALPLTALCAQRVAAWDAPTARAIIRERMARVDHPQQRRVLALAAVEAGEERRWVEAALSEFEDNVVTLECLRYRKFRVKSVADYRGG